MGGINRCARGMQKQYLISIIYVMGENLVFLLNLLYKLWKFMLYEERE
jgi:hypothetical protein